MHKIVFMFSGQGSQYYQMGKELFENEKCFRSHMTRLDEIVLNINGISVLDEVFSKTVKKTDVFSNILYTHPAIFMVEYSLGKLLKDEGIEPDYLIGTSMGEFVSAALAGAMDLSDTLEILIKQAEAFRTYCHKGGMIAVLGNPEIYYNSNMLNQNCELVSVNYNSHFVISAGFEEIMIVEKYLKSKDIPYQILPVDFGFHSRSIDPAEEYYLKVLSSCSYKKAEIPMVSCLDGKIIRDFPYDYFWKVVRRPICFTEAINTLEGQGEYLYIDLGPSGTLTNFAKHNLSIESRSQCLSVITPFNNELKNLDNLKKIFDNDKKLFERKDKKMIAYIFPGQGSQQKGMGENLFEEYKELTGIADEILGYSIKELCLEDPEQKLAQTQYTQPALFVVNALSYLKKVSENGVKPDFVAGHSLGEYNALFASGAIDFSTGLKLVKERGAIMSQAVGGGMAAIIGLTESAIKDVLRNNSLTDIDIANYNTPSQIVISGPKDKIEKAKPFFDAAGAKNYVVLRVSGAFHSRYMVEAGKKFEQYISQFNFSKLNIPVISNVYARAYKQGDISRNIIEQMSNSVKWTESIQYLMGKGEIEIVQVGPGNVLTGMVRAIRSEAPPLIVNDDMDYEEFEKKSAEVYSDSSDKSSISSKINQYQIAEFIPSILGNRDFKKDYGLKYAYVAGGMYRGIASKEAVVKLGKAGMLGFLGTGGMSFEHIENDIRFIQRELNNGEAYGMNFLYNPENPQKEEETVKLFLKLGVRNIEASAFMSITPSIVRYRLTGFKRNSQGLVVAENHIVAKVSRPEVAEMFLSPAPERIVEKLLKEGGITREQAEISRTMPMADDLSVEADSGGHTDHGVAYAVFPAIVKLRDDIMDKYKYHKRVRIGAAGGIGTPEAAAASFVMGADYIVTGSINQCTVEANTSEAVKDMLQQMNVQDTEYVPAGDMFEIGAKVQVLRKGLFFPARANKLYDLYRQYNSLDEIDEKTRTQIQEKYFKKSFSEVYEDVKKYYPYKEIEKAEKNPKIKMALIFKWYFGNSTELALNGSNSSKVDYQVPCGPALGAFNQWVKGTELENWKKRHIDEIGKKIMHETALLLNKRISNMLSDG